MGSRSFRCFVLILILVITLVPSVLSANVLSREAVYVEPALLASEAEFLSVIVTAGDSQVAARAVERAGGRVTGDLWLIDAVAASLPAGRLHALATDPQVLSIVDNKGVRAADEPWTGWVTQARAILGVYALDGVPQIPVVYLADGGFVSIAEDGEMLIVDADGSERARSVLSGGPFETAAVVAGDGTVYVAGEDEVVYALNPDGSTHWLFDGAQDCFLGGVVLGPAGTVHVADKGRSLYALDPATGQLLWQFDAPDGGQVQAAPAVAADGTVYLLTQGGHLFAVNPDGSLAWTFVADSGNPFLQSPLVGADGTVHVAGKGGSLFALNSDGSLRYRFDAAGEILAQPALAGDGSLFVAASSALYGLNADGSLRFTFLPSSSTFETSPILSVDGTVVYAAVKNKVLFAVDAAGGAELWQYTTEGKIEAGPVLDLEGNVVLGSKGHDLVILGPDGGFLYHRTMEDKLTQPASVAPSGDLTLCVGDEALVTLGNLSEQWDGRPDVQPTEDPKVWDLVYLATIDIGADALHAAGITGDGVTIAVVDSGVYFDENVKSILGKEVEWLFLGQADFVGDGLCGESGSGIRQYDGYCFTNHRASHDPYGHGTHVAGIIWNRFSDWATGVTVGVAPDAHILSVRVLGDQGVGTYEDVIEGIQYVVANRDTLNVRVINMSLSAEASTPYFVDPVNRAAERAWAEGIVVVAAAGNTGAAAEGITVPGNDPYVITVGAVDGDRTAGYWAGDFLPEWSGTGPTLDGFIKPDVLAPGVKVVSFMDAASWLAQQHPENSYDTLGLFRMSGTSMSTAVASGVVALMLQADPGLSPDQIKYRLAASAHPALTDEDDLIYNLFQQGMGRIWVPDAVWGSFSPDDQANQDMDILSDLAHGWDLDGDGEPDESELAYHYAGPVRRMLSDDERAYLYYAIDGDTGDDDICDDGEDCTMIALGVSWETDLSWADVETLELETLSWAGGRTLWAGGLEWQGGISWTAGRTLWAGGRTIWAGGRTIWAGGRTIWAGGRTIWAGDTSWVGGVDIITTQISSTMWVED